MKKTLLEMLKELDLNINQPCDGAIVAVVDGMDSETTNLKIRGQGRIAVREGLQIVQSILKSINIEFPNVESNFDIFVIKKLLDALNGSFGELQQAVSKEFGQKKEKEEKEEKVEVKQEGGKHDA
jgi:hypothetical protein